MAYSVRLRRTAGFGRTAGVVSGALAAATLLLMGGQAGAGSPAGPGPAQPADAYGFAAPASAALVGADLFVANNAGNSVTEVDASTGAFVSSIAGAAFKLDGPTAIEAVGTQLFVANGAGNSLTEFNASDGSLVRTISGARFKLSDPIALAAKSGHLFVLNSAGSVTEVATGTGRLIGVASGAQFGFDSPTAIAVAGRNLFVTNSAGNSVTEIDTQTRSFVATLSGPSYGFSEPTGVAFDGKHLWVTNQTGGSVTEIGPYTGNALQVIVNGNLPWPGPVTTGDGYVFAASPPGASPMVTQVTASTGSVNWMMCNTNGPYLFNNPQSLVVAGPDLWVVNEGGNSLTQMDAVTGALIQTVA